MRESCTLGMWADIRCLRNHMNVLFEKATTSLPQSPYHSEMLSSAGPERLKQLMGRS